MDKKATIKQLKDKVGKFCDSRDWGKYHNAKDLGLGIITEAAELLEIFRFHSNDEIQKMLEDKNKKEKIKAELTDVLWFILRFAQKYNIDLSSTLNKSLKKNTKRYPVKKCKGKNKKYTEL